MIQICIYIQYIHGNKIAFCELLQSLPAWKCGLKSLTSTGHVRRELSLPAWKCGLKYTDEHDFSLTYGHFLRGSVD